MKAKNILFTGLGVIVLLSTVAISLFVVYRKKPCGTRSPDTETICRDVKRNRYYLRHIELINWEMLSPELIRDPHYLWSDEQLLPKVCRDMAGDPTARFQMMDVNYSFHDETTEKLLVLRVNGKTYEYVLDYPLSRHSIAVPTSGTPSARVFPSQNVWILVVKYSRDKGIYVIDLPLKTGKHLQFIRYNDPRFKDYCSGLILYREDEDMRETFFSTGTWSFQSLYYHYTGCKLPDNVVDGEAQNYEAKYQLYWERGQD